MKPCSPFYLLCLLAASASAQDLFVSDYQSGSIIEIMPGGAQSTFASGLYPMGLAFNGAGDLFEADSSGNIYEFINDNGVLSPSPAIFASGLSDPYALTFDNTADLFVSGWNGQNAWYITEITPGGMQSTFGFDVSEPYALACNSSGDLFEADWGSGNIYEFAPGGAQSTFVSGPDYPLGLAFNSAGTLFVSHNEVNGYISEITPDGVQNLFVSGLDDPQGLAFDSSGNLFVMDNGNGDITEITPDGTQSTFASGLGSSTYLAVQPVPEPPALGLFAVGATALLVCRRRKNTKKHPIYARNTSHF